MTKKADKPVVFRDAAQYQDQKYGWDYRIPIPQLKHERWGRMEVMLEPNVKRGAIRSLYLWFRHHEIPELAEPFEIATPHADKHTGVTSHDIKGTASFFAGTWCVSVCGEHKGNMILSSYPPDGTTALVLCLLTTSISIHYEING
jgi:hypothetical protein